MLKTLRIIMRFPKFILLNFLLTIRIKIERKRLKLNAAKKERLKRKLNMKNQQPEEKNISTASELPPFPGSEKEVGYPNSLIGDKAVAESPDVQELAKDLVTAGFEIANIINPKIRVLDEKEKSDLGKPLAKVVVKYDLGKYLSYLSYVDEMMLAYHGIKIVAVRIKEVKEAKDVRSDGRKEGERKDLTNKEPNPTTPI